MTDHSYEGNSYYVGWKVIGFPGLKSLADTNTLKYSFKDYYHQDYDWADLIPYLKEKKGD